MKRRTAWVLTKIVRRLLGLPANRRPSPPLRKQGPHVRTAAEWQLETREAPGDALGGLVLASLGILATRDPLGGAAALLGERSALRLLAADPQAGPAARHAARALLDALPTVPAGGQGYPGTGATSAGQGGAGAAAEPGRLIPGSGKPSARAGQGALEQDPLVRDFAARLLCFWDTFAPHSLGHPGGAGAHLPGAGQFGAGLSDGIHAGSGHGPSAGANGPALATPGAGRASASEAQLLSLAEALAGEARTGGAGSGHGPQRPAATPTRAPHHHARRPAHRPRAHGVVSPLRLPSPASGSHLTPASAGLVPVDPAINATEGAFFSGGVGTFVDMDGNRSPGVYSVQIGWGDSTPSGGGSVVYMGGNPSGGSTFQVNGSHTYAEEGTFTVTVSVTDNADQARTTITSQAAVADVALTVQGTPAGPATARTAFTAQLATFTDAGPAEALGDYTATISWGDGTPNGTGTVGSGPNGTFTVTGTHTYASAGSYAAKVTATDDGGATGNATDTIQVNQSSGGGGGGGGGSGGSGGALTMTAGGYSATEGVSGGSQVLATFTDSDGNPNPTYYTATITWGDGGQTQGSVSGSGNPFQVSGSILTTEEGTSSYTVRVTDMNDHATATAVGTAWIDDAPLTAGAVTPPALAAGVPFSGTVASFTDADPNGTVSDYVSQINWGDGARDWGSISAGPSGNFLVAGSHLYAQPGTYTVLVTVVDHGSPVSISYTVNVAAPPLSFNPVSPALVEGAAQTVTLGTFTDPDGDTNPADFTASISWGDGTPPTPGTVSAAAGGALQVTGNYTYAEEGNPTITVTITDSVDGVQSAFPTTAAVRDADLSATGLSFTATAGQSFTVPLVAFTDADPNGSLGDYTASIDWGDQQTDGGSIAAAQTGFQASGGHTYATAGTYTVKVTVYDTGGASTTADATATVLPPAAGVQASNLAATEGQAFSGTVATFTPPNPDPGSSAYSVTIGWGDGSQSDGTLTPDGHGNYTVSGSHTYADETSAGSPDTFTVTILNTQDPSASPLLASASATVGDAALTPAGLTFGAFTGAATGAIAVGQFTDANPQASTKDFTASIDWGDGTAAGTGTAGPAPGGGFQVTGDHTYTVSGTYAVAITVTDDGGQTTTIDSTALVGTGTTASVQATEGTQFSGTVATFNGSMFQASSPTIDWGDGTTSAGTLVLAGIGQFGVSGSHTWADEDTYTLQVSVQISGTTQTLKGPAVVADAALTAQGVTLSAGVGQPLVAPPAQAVVATFTDANPQASLADFTATIDWGDGSDAATGTAQPDPVRGFDVVGNYVYAAPGTYTVTTTITDDGGQTATANSTVNVGVQEGQPYSVAIPVAAPGSQPSPGTSYTATIAWGDGSTSDGAVSPVTGSSGPLQLSVSGVHVYTEKGTYTVTATVSDPSGDQASGSASAAVADAPLTGYGLDAAAVAGYATGPVAVGGFTDANPYAATDDFLPGDYTVSINWGDLSPATGGTVQANSDGSFSVVGDHTYAEAGTYEVFTTITDEGGQSTTAQGAVVVVAPWGIIDGGTGQRGNDPDGAYLVTLGEATVDLNQGALRLSHPLDFDLNPGTDVGRAPALVYNSATVDVRPVIQIQVQSDPGGAVPVEAEVQLTWDGAAQDPVAFDTSGELPGAIYTLAVQPDQPVGVSGAYPWSATVTFTFPDGSTKQATTSGTAYVVARDNSPYGAGWGIDGVDQLVVGPTGVLWVTGAGDSRFFEGTGGTYTSPPEDFGTLVKNDDGSFTYTAKDQTKWNFNPVGDLTSVVDTHNLATTYGYDGEGRLTQVGAIDGGVTTLGYDSSTGVLSSIAEPGNRVIIVQGDGNGNLAGLIDVDGSTRGFGYDGAHRLTSDRWAPLDAGFTYDPASGLLTGVDRGLGTTYAVAAAAGQGLDAVTSGPAWASLTDALNDTTRYLLDQRGRLLQEVLPDGSSTYTYRRDAAGQVTLALDPLHRPTLYTYAYGPYSTSQGGGDGDLLQVRHADGSFEAYQYDPTFHHVTQARNALGVTETDTYDPGTGDLLSGADALGNTTVYAWAGGLLQSVTDPLGHQTSYVYNAARRQTAVFDGMHVPTWTSYDAAGNPATTTDAYLHVTQTVYSPRGLLVKTIDALTDVTTYAYNAYGQQTGETNARGFTSTTGYDQRGFVVTQTDDANVVVARDQYDAAGDLTRVTDADSQPTVYTYDADGRQTAVTDALQETTTTGYDAAGEATGTTDPLLRTTSAAYDVLGRQVASTDGLGHTSYTLYDVAGRAVATIDPLGLTTWTAYDRDDRPVAVRDPRGAVTTTGYDAAGNVVLTTDGLGQPTITTYDADNRPVTVTDPTDALTVTKYDLVGNAVQVLDGRGQPTVYSYDALNRRVGVTDPDGNTTWTVYDAVGNPVVLDNPRTRDAANTAELRFYDPDNRLVRDIDHNGNTSTWTYDPAGNVLVADVNGRGTRTGYDAVNRPFITWDANGDPAETMYDAGGEVTATMDGAGDVTMDAYDAAGRQTATRDANRALTQSQYDAGGRLTAVTDADRNTTQYRYDAAGNTVAVIDPLGHVTASAYDAADRLVSRTDRDGRTTAYAYDGDGRVLTEAWYDAGGALTDTRQYSYDQAGNLLTAANGYGGYVYTYDPAGRVLTQRDPFGLGLSYGYDADGNRTGVLDSLGGQVASAYDWGGRLTSRQFGGAGQTPVRLDLTYTSEGDVQTLTRYTDLAGTQVAGRSVYTYDAGGRLTELQQYDTNATVAHYAYVYDPADRLTQEWDSGTTTAYSYDKTGQLLTAGGHGYGYDPTGNRTMAGYQTAADNRLASDGTWSYAYDNEGNVVLKTGVATGETWSYGYDNANHLTSAVHKDGSGALLAQVTYRYDALGNRVEADTYTAATGQTVVQRFAYDGTNAWADLDGSNGLVMRRLYLDGADQPFARIDAGGTAAWYLADHLGSIRDVVSYAGTSVLDHVDYDAYGNITAETQPGNGDRYKYTGAEFDATTGLQYNRARYYDSKIGRWMSQDPIGFSAGDVDLYRYVQNEPTLEGDPPGTGTPDEITKGRLQYFEKAGWVDWEHATPDAAEALIAKIKQELGKGINAPSRAYANNFSILGGGQELCTVPDSFLKGNGYIKIDFQNPPSRSPLRGLVYPVVTYIIKDSLKDNEILPVALGIFEDYQLIFETWQEIYGPNNPFGRSNSGFSQEDPFSDLIGFYMAARPDLHLDKEKLSNDYFGQRLSNSEARELLNKLGNDLGWRMNKHRDFTPVDHNNDTTSLKGHPMKVPDLFKSIDAAKTNSLWLRLEKDDWFSTMVNRADKETSKLPK